MNRDDVTTWLRSLHPDEAARVLAEVLPAFADDRYFDLWEAHGFHLIRSSYLSPIPVVSSLDDAVFEAQSRLAGIDLHPERQLRLLAEVFPRFRPEYDTFRTIAGDDPAEFYFENPFFSGTDALVLYCMIRHLRPARVLEVGSGFSTRVSARAVLTNGTGNLQCIEPYPSPELVVGFRGLDRLFTSKVQDMGLEPFLALESGDILFIDSTHICAIASDVNFLFLEVLPQLQPGVVVHVHDIFLPFEYKREWLRKYHLFWNEQYLLQAFLAFNSSFEVLFANSYMAHHSRDAMVATFPNSPWWGGGSFWMRRITG